MKEKLLLLAEYAEVGAKFSCCECAFSSDTYESLYDHYGSIHRGQVGTVCPLCGYQTLATKTLLSHVGSSVHAGLPYQVRQAALQVCDSAKPFAPSVQPQSDCHRIRSAVAAGQVVDLWSLLQLVDLRVYIDHRVAQSRFVCQICCEICEDLPQLLLHCRRAHVGAWFYLCLFCGFSTSNRQRLAEHVNAVKSHLFIPSEIRAAACKLYDGVDLRCNVSLTGKWTAKKSEAEQYRNAWEIMSQQDFTQFAPFVRATADFSCRVCGAPCDDFYELCSHIRLHHETFFFICPFCGLHVASKKKLKIHLASVGHRDMIPKYVLDALESIYKPIIVPFRTISSYGVGKHQGAARWREFFKQDLSSLSMYVTANADFTCRLCKQPCDDFMQLVCHLYNEHNSLWLYTCPLCGMQFWERKRFLAQHLITHTTVPLHVLERVRLLFELTIDEESSGRKRRYEQEVTNVTLETARSDEELDDWSSARGARAEPKTWNRFAKLDFSAYEAYRVGEVEFRCRVCCHVFGDFHSLAFHIRDNHSLIFLYICPLCGFQHRSKAELMKHMGRKSHAHLPPELLSKFDQQLNDLHRARMRNKTKLPAIAMATSSVSNVNQSDIVGFGCPDDGVSDWVLCIEECVSRVGACVAYEVRDVYALACLDELSSVATETASALRCAVCGAVCGDYKALQIHSMDAHRTVWAQCPQCGEACARWEQLHEHAQSEHRTALAGRRASAGQYQLQLFFESAAPKNFACPVCGHTSATLAALWCHLSDEHWLTGRRRSLILVHTLNAHVFFCCYGNERFGRVQQLQLHYLALADQLERDTKPAAGITQSLQCLLCAAAMPSSAALGAHYYSSHAPMDLFAESAAPGAQPRPVRHCPVCLCETRHLAAHVRNHQQWTLAASSVAAGDAFNGADDPPELLLAEQRPAGCPFCADGAELRDAAALVRHVRLQHGLVLRYRCALSGCGFVTPLVADFLGHCRQHSHTGCFVCSLCNEHFVDHAPFLAHQLMHRGASADAAALPLATAGVGVQLAANAPSLACCWPSCGAAFGDQRRLAVHWKSHAPLRVHVCRWCRQSFTLKHHLATHLRNQHGAQLSLPDCHDDGVVSLGTLGQLDTVEAESVLDAADLYELVEDDSAQALGLDTYPLLSLGARLEDESAAGRDWHSDLEF